MEEPFCVKVSATIYRFYRRELPALTKAALVGIVLWVILAFVVFSPGFTFAPTGGIPAKVSSLAVSEKTSEAGIFRDSEPLFLPTLRNFGTENIPKELTLRETSFLPFGEILSLYSASEVIRPKSAQRLPKAEDALGPDAWHLGRGFSAVADTAEHPVAAVGTLVRIEDADTGEVVFEGELEGVVNDSDTMLLVPAEFFCGIASGFGKPTVMTVRSCGNTERDSQIIEATSKILNSLKLNAGLFRIFVD